VAGLPNVSAIWNAHVAAAIDAYRQEGFADKILELVRHLMPIDTAAAHIYSKERAPMLVFDRLRPSERNIFYQKYLTGLYLVSPFYQAFLSGTFTGVYCLNQLAPDHFRRSEYFRNYFSHISATDIIGVFIPLSIDEVVLLTFALNEGKARFSTREVALLVSAEPALASLLRLHCAHQSASAPQQEAKADDIHASYIALFETFGAPLLTRREREIVHYILRGFSSKAMARELELSPETVRVHRKNAYAKLEVRTQGKLFNLFLENLLSGDSGKST